MRPNFAGMARPHTNGPISDSSYPCRARSRLWSAHRCAQRTSPADGFTHLLHPPPWEGAMRPNFAGMA